MAARVFWNTSRREYVARFLSHLTLLLVGALGTTELFKLGWGIKLLTAGMAAVMIVGGTVIQPHEPKTEEE